MTAAEGAGPPPLLRLRGVVKGYGDASRRQPVLGGIDLDVMQGEYLALMGASGSGKSTLMNLIGLLDRCDGGRMLLDGEEVSTLDAAALAGIRNRRIGFIFQSFHLLKRMNVQDNVALPLLYAGASPAAAHRRAGELLEQVGLETLRHRLPNQLSGGQQQRVAIARALVNRPVLLLADEPTGNLDTQTTEEVLSIFRTLHRSQGLTILMVTHEPDVAQHAKRLIRIKDGRIASDGPPPGRPS